MAFRHWLTASWIVLVAAPAVADPIEEQVETALEYYREGDIAGAIDELKFVIGEMQAKLADLYAETFPPAPEGWTAEPVQSEGGAAFMGGGAMLNRTYSEEGGQGRIQAQLLIDNPMIQGMLGLFSNPSMLASQPNMQRVRIGRDNAILEFDDSAGRGEINFPFHGRALLKVEGSNLESGEFLIELIESWDMDGLRAAAGL